eukprot:gene27213-biopygen7451
MCFDSIVTGSAASIPARFRSRTPSVRRRRIRRVLFVEGYGELKYTIFAERRFRTYTLRILRRLTEGVRDLNRAGIEAADPVTIESKHIVQPTWLKN